MARPVKWSRDVHAIRERAERSRTETWSRKDIEHLFGISRPSAQSLMKAIGGVQIVGGTHFVDRASLLAFLSKMVAAESVDAALRARHDTAEPVPPIFPLRISLPQDLRRITIADLPENVTLKCGELRITGSDAEHILEGLVALAGVMQSDLEAVQRRLDPPPQPLVIDDELRNLILEMRDLHRP